MPQIGEQAPDFELPNQDGKIIKLSDYRGKKVIIFAYPKAFTGGCTTQACGFRDHFPQIEAGNGVVFGLSPDDQELLKKYEQQGTSVLVTESSNQQVDVKLIPAQ